MFWNLAFIVEDGEAEVRYTHILKTLQADSNVWFVAVLEDGTSRRLVVHFREGCDLPDNPVMHHLDSVYGPTPITRKDPLDIILSEDYIND